MSPEHEKSQEKCDTCARKTILIGLFANLFLAAFKLFIGFLGRSRALIGSGLCNLSDITSAVVVILGVKYSKKPANKFFPYGYGKVEFITQFAMSLFMLLGTAALFFSSFFVIMHRVIVIPHLVVFFTAVLSAMINGLIYKFAHCGAHELNSPVLEAHAEHNKIDVVSSLLVAVAVIFARKGMHWVDPLIAIFECLHVMHGSGIILWQGVKGIMDSGMSEDYTEKIKDRILEVGGIEKVNTVLARQVGRAIVLDVTVQLNPELSVLEAKSINQTIKAFLRKTDKHISKIAIQVVPAQ